VIAGGSGQNTLTSSGVLSAILFTGGKVTSQRMTCDRKFLAMFFFGNVLLGYVLLEAS
jgi:hypothetical protein